MTFQYQTEGTCSKLIMLDIDSDGVIRNVGFVGGCNGNLKGISRLVIGRKAAEVADSLSGTTCGSKPTSCPDQLARAIRQALQKLENQQENG